MRLSQELFKSLHIEEQQRAPGILSTIDREVHYRHLQPLPSNFANEKSPGHPAVTSDLSYYN